ncbi:TonB-dependent receptor [Pedobacter sp. BS3]|uniref:SusC/RagA family TonB-linked outer membrane protein n=1 Tax=Pedobacter sp. BS3 TaxID=2567937 RepID=UPI0011EFC566|nr:TonB-dependent receptor [Pedobacter sp. BS3]TZF83643.1 TonB-dependent receptor [Pedobacter sp. BS3]
MKKILPLCFSLMLGVATLTNAQTARQITGNVKDADTNESLIGVSIVIKGETKGTQTDANGNFSITTSAKGNITLVARYIGYKTQEITVTGNQNTAHFRLKNDNIQLNEVVAIGYATVNRRDLTGSVSSVGEKQLKDIPINSAAEALAGRLAGVQVTSSEGAPGSEVQIKVRGGGSITQDNSPLYVIDGIVVDDGLSSLSPQDIESVDVLKDASATSIYGARGANGVVIITTKGGKVMKTRVNYNGLVGLKSLANELDVMHPYDFVISQYERSRGLTTTENGFAETYGNWEDLDQYKSVPFIDWQKKTFGNDAITQTHNVSIVGGTKTTQFNLSMTSNGEDGIMLNSDFDRKLVNFRFDTHVSNALRAGFNIRYNNQVITGAGTSDAGAVSYNLLRHTIKYRPLLIGNLSPEDLDEAYYEETNTGNGVGIINPVLLSDAMYRKRYTKVTNLNGYINYTFNKHFSFKSTLGVNYTNQTLNSFYDYITSKARNQGAGMPMVSVVTNNISSLTNSNVFSYTNSKKSDHHFDALLGNEFYNVSAKSLDNELKNFPVGITAEKALNQLNIGTSVPSYPLATAYESRIVSFFGRANYAYKDKYLATFSMRADGSSKFAPDKRWGYFPSGAVAWRISQEDFMKNIPVISDLKLRASYGTSGNNRMDDYLYMNIFSSTYNDLPVKYALNEQVVPGYTVSSLANKNLKWETTVSRNIGLDLSLLKDRIQLTVDAYKNSVRDLLILVPIPPTAGYTTQMQNVGSTSNRGLEFQLNAVAIRHKNFTWSTNFNMAFNRNKIEKLSNQQNSYLTNSGFGISGQPADYIVKVGEPVGTMYGFVSDGFYTVDDFNYDAATSQYTLKPGVTDVSNAIGIAQPGWMKLKDLDGNQVIDESDKTIIGNANPKFTGGLNQQFTYKNFDLSVFVNFVYGNKVYNANKIEFTNGYSRNNNSLAIMNNRWRTIDNNGNVIQQVVTISGQQVVTGVPPEELAAINKNASIWMPISGVGAWYPTSWAMEDGSFLRINNITLGYTFPVRLLSPLKIKNLRVYGTVNNLAVITGYSGYDPEVNTRRTTPVTPGVDWSAYPRSRSFILGLNLSL